MKSGLIGIGLRVLLVFRKRREKKKRKPDNSGSKIAPTVPSELIVNTGKLAGRKTSVSPQTDPTSCRAEPATMARVQAAWQGEAGAGGNDAH